MVILFDQGTPLPLRRHLRGHLVRTAAQQGWDTLVNGALLSAAEQAHFDLLLTTDKNLSYQQELSSRHIAVRVLGQQQWPILQDHVELVKAAIDAATPGSFGIIEIPPGD